MRRFKTSLASVALSLFLGSISLFAQTEKPDSTKNQARAVAQVEIKGEAQGDLQIQPDKLAVDSDDTTRTSVRPSVEVKPAATASPDTESKTVEPKVATQPPTKPAAVPAEQRRFALTFNDLKFDKDKDEDFDRKLLTSKINGYHGGKVKIRGYIRPNFKQSGITKFIFVRDNKVCCFGKQAAIFDNILVRLDEGESANYTVRPITIEGDFVLKEYRGDNGKVWSLYRMYNAKVK